MNTIGDLRKALDLATDNQVRNRIDAIKDLLYSHLRRGPNNQILIADSGLTLLRQLQELYDSGLTMTEASSVMQTNAAMKDVKDQISASGLTPNQDKPSEGEHVIALLREEIAFLRTRVAYLEEQQTKPRSQQFSQTWWERMRGEISGT
ncbi:MAG: hypothetical protein U9Q94_04945 [Candidatus Bipolaricaulota bacterium]|nr:hypothetical protein [Candidatus Bipolaricaulota bacterium]